jgi:hypothetical protein
LDFLAVTNTRYLKMVLQKIALNTNAFCGIIPDLLRNVNQIFALLRCYAVFI